MIWQTNQREVVIDANQDRIDAILKSSEDRPSMCAALIKLIGVKDPEVGWFKGLVEDVNAILEAAA